MQSRSENRSHDAWFRAEVEQALKEADDPAIEQISDENMKSEWELRRAELVNQQTA